MPHWNYCVVARFDEATDKKLTELKAAFLAEGYGGVATNWPPHITLATYETVSGDTLKTWTAEYAGAQAPFDVALASCGILPPGGDKAETAVLYAAPCSSRQLIDFYFGFHTKLDEYCGDSGWFYSAAFGHPAIHATIGIVDVKRLQRALELVFAGGIFGKSQIEALEVYKYPMELVARYELGVRTIVVIPWQKEWPGEFAKIKRELDEVLSDTVISIEHVGSTSVEGLAAKPIIDMDIVIEESKFEAVKERLASIGYIHNGDQGIPTREAFKYIGKDHLMKHHLYVCPRNSPELHRHLALRDCLRVNPDLRDKYSNIKFEMAKKYPYDIDAYIDGKGDVVREIYRVWEEQRHYEL
jgi:GrpB-like predicted nucleotidyltransferase (UPF0157 family)